MRSVVQRVRRARVTVDGQEVGRIGPGMLVLLAAAPEDSRAQTRWMAEKLCGLRIFSDETGKMNVSLTDVQGAMLVVSQFTLYGDCKKGKRPSYSRAAPSEHAERVYREFIEEVRSRGVPVQHGVFGAMMIVELDNDGPVTLIVDSPEGPG
jgi:D-tyrosyl-tRNA(Tyr) deacylase